MRAMHVSTHRRAFCLARCTSCTHNVRRLKRMHVCALEHVHRPLFIYSVLHVHALSRSWIRERLPDARVHTARSVHADRSHVSWTQRVAPSSHVSKGHVGYAGRARVLALRTVQLPDVHVRVSVAHVAAARRASPLDACTFDQESVAGFTANELDGRTGSNLEVSSAAATCTTLTRMHVQLIERAQR